MNATITLDSSIILFGQRLRRQRRVSSFLAAELYLSITLKKQVMKDPKNNNNESLNAETIQQVGNDFSEAMPTVHLKRKRSESNDDKHDAAVIMESDKELSATQQLKQDVANTLAAWNKRQVCSAIFANIPESKQERFLELTRNETEYPVKDHEGESKVIRMEIVNGKKFSFIEFPDKLTAASIVSVFNAVESYSTAFYTAKANAAESAKKAQEVKANALRTLLDSGILTQEEYNAKMQLL